MSEGKCRLTPDQVKELSEVDSHQHPVLGPAFATVKKGSVNAAMAHIRQLESTVARLREALEYIADPIGAAKRKIKESNGELKLNADMAIRLSESASHLRDVARTALEETK